jgi:hypothetical protein
MLRFCGHKLITCKNGNLHVVTLKGVLISTVTYDSQSVKTLLLIGVSGVPRGGGGGVWGAQTPPQNYEAEPNSEIHGK